MSYDTFVSSIADIFNVLNLLLFAQFLDVFINYLPLHLNPRPLIADVVEDVPGHPLEHGIVGGELIVQLV